MMKLSKSRADKNTPKQGAFLDNFRWIDQQPVLNWILLIQLFSCLPLMFYLKPWIGVVVSCAISYRYAMQRFQIKPVAQWVRVLIVFTCAIILVLQHAGLSGREAGVSLAVLMFGLKAIEIKKNRDIIVTLLVSYFLIVGIFLYNQSVFIAAYSILLMLLITGAMIHCYSFQAAATIQVTEIKSSVKMAAKLLGQAVPLAVILFLFFPRFSEPLWNLQSKGAAGTGVSDSMHPGAIGNLAQDNSVAFRFKFFGDVPSSDKLYWRAMVLDEFDGRSWTVGERYFFNTEQVEIKSEPIDYEITIESHNNPWIYQLEHSSIQGIGATPKDDLSWSLNYKLSRVARYQGRWYSDITFDKELSRWQWQRYTEIPQQGNEKTKRWANQLWQQSDSTGEFLRKVEQFINSQEFHYTLQPEINRGDIIDDFFMNTREGFCEHYASALVYIMRSLGVPARVVVGYQGGEMNPLDDYYIVRQKDAHAWTEVWIPEQGWQRYDPTSWIHPTRVDLSLNQAVNQRSEALNLIDVSLSKSLGVIQQAQYMWDSFNQNWNDLFLNYNSDQQIDIYQYFKVGHMDWYTIGLFLVTAIMLFISLWVWYLVKRAPKREQWEQWFYQVQQVLIQKQLKSSKTRKRGTKAQQYAGYDNDFESLGPKQFFAQLRSAFPQQQKEIAAVEKQYLRYRYARKNTNQVKMPDSFKHLLRSLKRALK